jgi:hypothetical protein
MAFMYPNPASDYTISGVPPAANLLYDGGPRFYADPWRLSSIVGGGSNAWLDSMYASSLAYAQTASGITTAPTVSLSDTTSPLAALSTQVSALLAALIPAQQLTPTTTGDLPTQGTWKPAEPVKPQTKEIVRTVRELGGGFGAGGFKLPPGNGLLVCNNGVLSMITGDEGQVPIVAADGTISFDDPVVLA